MVADDLNDFVYACSLGTNLRKTMMTGFIATAKFEETIKLYGEGATPEAAMADFINSGEFNEHCITHDIPDNSTVEVAVYKAIYNGSPEWDDELFDPNWQWALGERVYAKNIKFLI